MPQFDRGDLTVDGELKEALDILRWANITGISILLNFICIYLHLNSRAIAILINILIDIFNSADYAAHLNINIGLVSPGEIQVI
jgi:hypothetical protein